MSLGPSTPAPGRAPGGGQLRPGTRVPLRCDAEVLANRAEAGPNRRLELRIPDWPGFDPGQFAMLSPGALGATPRSDPLLPRPMAIYRARADGSAERADSSAERADGTAARVEILYKVSGRGTALLADALPGQAVSWVGPLGNGFELPDMGERALLVAGGTGIASVYELARRLVEAQRPAQVLLGARSATDLMGVEDFEGLGVAVSVATEDGSRGESGLVTALLEAALAEPGTSSRVYTCGPTPMMRRCAELAAAADAACVASLENHMACGFGVCLGCAAPRAAGGYALVCRDGPAFDAADVAWETLP